MIFVDLRLRTCGYLYIIKFTVLFWITYVVATAPTKVQNKILLNISHF